MAPNPGSSVSGYLSQCCFRLRDALIVPCTAVVLVYCFLLLALCTPIAFACMALDGSINKRYQPEFHAQGLDLLVNCSLLAMGTLAWLVLGALVYVIVLHA